MELSFCLKLKRPVENWRQKNEDFGPPNDWDKRCIRTTRA